MNDLENNFQGNGELEDNTPVGAIAIIGMGGRFPGAKDIDEFWQNLYNGVESVKFFNRDELLKMGIDEHLLDNPKFVAADAILDDMDKFDAAFFDYSAREAEIMDPQHRLFLETAWEVLESAGYSSDLYDGRIAVYVGANLSGYMVRNLYSNPGLVENVGTFKIMIANSQDFLATRVSYKMNLMGPSVNVNTLCSSSMVGVHFACQNLLNYSCDIAMAGGVSFQISRNESFFYQEGGIGSGDGHCRAYDSKANGTVSGSGLAIVALKRLEDAIADGDYIHAVIRGTGINNDGSNKNSYTAPNVDGQAECIAEAIAMSGVDPETITYIDGHGTGTDLGDPIEIAALTKAFRAHTKKKQFCAIGSVKTNIGHLVTAGGLASVVKTVEAIKHRVIPPSLNFEQPNPKIDFVNSPFYVNNKLTQWVTKDYPLRAGVSSFGIGGTNTHVILEEAPAPEPSEKSARPWQLITLSAKTATALDKMTSNLKLHLKKNPELNLADVAFTLHVGRKSFNHRRIVLCSDSDDLVNKLETDQVYSRFQKPKEQPVVYMFPGEGSQYVGMGAELYKTESVFRKTIDNCAKLLEPLLGMDVRRVIYSYADVTRNYANVTTGYADVTTGYTNVTTGYADVTKNYANVTTGYADVTKDYIDQENIARAVIFITEYALAKLFMSWEVTPQYMLGEGVGEYVAACIAGVLSLEDVLTIVTCGYAELSEKFRKVTFNAPKIPFISCVTGTWIEDSEATSPDYWMRQRVAVCFTQGLEEVLKDYNQILLEIGPGNKLTTEANKLRKQDVEQAILPTMKSVADQQSDVYVLLQSVGQFWLYGGRVNWNKLYTNERRHRIPLPTYPFERQRYWIEPGKRSVVVEKPEVTLKSKEDITEGIIGSGYKEGKLTITLNLNAVDGEGRKKQLEEVLQFKERLEEFCKTFTSISPKIDVSPVGLMVEQDSDQSSLDFSGKLPKRPRPELETPYVAPRNEAEKIIVERWQEVLGFNMIGINDDFFALGGHSLIAAAVASDLSKIFEVQIPLRQLFETTTVAGIAELIETYKWATQTAQEVAVGEEELESGTI